MSATLYTHAEWPENVEAAKLAGEQIEKAVNSVELNCKSRKRAADWSIRSPCGLTTYMVAGSCNVLKIPSIHFRFEIRRAA